jgi:hypothetical protein
MNFGVTIGLELIQRAALVHIFSNLNAAIRERAEYAHESDEALAEFLGQPYEKTEVEEIANENFYEGHRPSLIKAPIENYPNVSVWCVRATPHPESVLSDHTNIWNVLLFVEIMCKSERDEGEVNRRIIRTTEALNAVMQNDPSLGGTVTGFETDVTPSLSDVFVRKRDTSYGDPWFWQGARLEYVVRKDAVLPQSASGSNFRALPDGMTAADFAALDQS